MRAAGRPLRSRATDLRTDERPVSSRPDLASVSLVKEPERPVTMDG
jgi:hypothetical protein